MDISTVADLVSQLRKKVDMQNKESVELTSVYLLEGCGKTHAKINDTIPRTRIDMGIRACGICPSTGIYTKVSAVPYRPLALKTTTFSNKDLRKTLSQYVMPKGCWPMALQM